MRKIIKSSLALLALLTPLTAQSAIIDVELNTGMSFQDEGTTTYNDTALLKSLDGNWAPTTAGTVVFDYYATGTSDRYFDAASLNFDLSAIGYQNITDIDLLFYGRLGAYPNTSWRHYMVQDGAYNNSYEDLAAGVPGSSTIDLIGEQWYSSNLNIASLSSNSFDVTLRLWNVEVDQVKLVVTTVAEPSIFALMGLGLVGLGFSARTKKSLVA
ncbi:MAG: PEP-CTERM sorting domain-containing protein [Gammaproteobacteria bacterium]|nr:PEP-CTERM sorting domain-containing protein [Gammaproteobacteria bacterium]